MRHTASYHHMATCMAQTAAIRQQIAWVDNAVSGLDGKAVVALVGMFPEIIKCYHVGTHDARMLGTISHPTSARFSVDVEFPMEH